MAIFFMTGFMIPLPSNVVGTMIIIGRLRRGKLYIRPLSTCNCKTRPVNNCLLILWAELEGRGMEGGG